MIDTRVFRRPSSRRDRRPSRRPTLWKLRAWDVLEERALMATIPVFQTYTSLPGGNLPADGNLAEVQGAPILPIQVMERTVVAGALPASDPGDVVQVQLQAGEPLTLSLSAPSASTSPITIELANPAGKVVAKNSGVSTDPDTGLAFTGSALSYTATAAGTYSIAVLNANPATAPADPTARSYTLNIRPIGMASISTLIDQNNNATIDENGNSSSPLAFQGGAVYAQLQAGRLNIIGPTGYGFDIRGNWTSIAIPSGNGQTMYAYVATAGIQLDTPIGLLPMPLPPSGYMLFTTTPSSFGTSTFGQIATSQISTGLQWLDDLAEDYFTPTFGMTYYDSTNAVGLQVTQGKQIGLSLGSTINSNVDPNAPLYSAIPYLYFNSSSGFGATFGTVSVGVVQSNISVVVDPADPMFYIGAVLPAIPVFSSAGFGLSANGLIPITLAQMPSHYAGGKTFSGNVYAQLEVNIPLPVPPPPDPSILAVNLNGAVDLNLNAENDGGLLTFLQENPDQFALALATNTLPILLATNPSLLAEFSFAVNGKEGLTISTPGFPASATFTITQGTLIDTGTTSPELDFRGLTTNNFATGTPFANFNSYIQPTANFITDGYAVPGLLSATYTAQFNYFGSTAMLTTTIMVANFATSSPSFSATATGMLTLAGGSTSSVTGTVDNSGNWSVTGMGTFVIGGFTLGSGQVTVVPQGISLSGNVNLGTIGTATFTASAVTNGNFTLTSTVMTNFGIVGMPTSNTSLTLTNSGMTAATAVEFLGQQASLAGSIQTNNTFSLSGTINAGFSFLGITPSSTVLVTLANGGGATSLGGTFDLNFSVTTLGLTASLDVLTTVYLAFAGFDIPSYYGQGVVTGTFVGVSVSTTATVVNNALVFSVGALGYSLSVSIPLPF
jgi:hypothetical protein